METLPSHPFSFFWPILGCSQSGDHRRRKDLAKVGYIPNMKLKKF
jgi:hypothetical protein